MHRTRRIGQRGDGVGSTRRLTICLCVCAPIHPHPTGTAHVEQGAVVGNGGGRTTPTPPRSRLISEDALSKLE